MAEMSDNKLADNKSMRDVIVKRYRHQTFVIILVFGVIMIAAWLKLIEPSVTGTLIGTTIGSVFKFPYRPNQDNDKDKDKSNQQA